MNKILAYVKDLHRLNCSLVDPGFMPSPTVFNAFAWGFVEEVTEYESARLCDKKKEAGDVLAYTVLLLLCVANEEDVAEVILTWVDASFKPLSFYSNLKRINREGEKFDWRNVMRGCTSILNDAEDAHSITFEEIMATNISKLQDRANRNTLHSGSGDNR